MSSERADVLVVGAGASGGVVGKRLAEAGFAVVCLEQGEWPDRADYPGPKPDWELQALRRWSADPTVRRDPADYPVNADESDMVPLMFNGVGGSMILYAGDWPRMPPSDFRVRTLDGVADDWPLTYEELEPFYDRIAREVGVSGLAGDPAYPEGEDLPLPALPLGDGVIDVVRAHDRLGWHWWPAPSAILSLPYRGRHPCAQWGTCMQGCPEGAKASTDVTHWPEAIAHGARLVTGARVVRLVMGSNRLVQGAEYVDAGGETHLVKADVVVLAANAVGTARLLLASSGNEFPDGLANSSGLVGRRLMMHPFAVVTGVFERFLRTWTGNVGSRVHCLQFYETDTDRGFVRGAKWSLAPSTGGPLNAALPARAGEGVGPGSSSQRAGALRPLPQLGHLRRGPAGRAQPRGAGPGPSRRLRAARCEGRLHDVRELAPAPGLPRGACRRVAFRGRGRPRRHAGGDAKRRLAPPRHSANGSRPGVVVDPWGKAHDVDNLYVVDGSVFVTSGGVNPTNSICSLALRFADGIVARRANQRVPA